MKDHTEKSTLKIPCGQGIKCEEGYGASVIDTQHGSVNLNQLISILVLFFARKMQHLF